jgi:PAS domain S-box-containing protein
MSWITIVWSMNAAACLTLAAIYFVVWCKQRGSWMYLAFSCSAVAGAALTAFELTQLRAHTVEQFSAVLRWTQFPVWMLVVSLVIFVRLYFHAGRPWLAWSVCGLRTLALILNFILVPNLSYREITSLRRVGWWGGETVPVPVGVTSPWILVAQLSSLLLIVFFIDATITVWRRDKRKRGLGIVLSLFGLIAVGQALLVVWGIIQVPFLACFSILGLLAAMGYELSNDMFQAAQLTRKLKESEERLNLAAESANFGVWEWNLNKDEVRVGRSRRELLGLPSSGAVRFENYISRVHAEDRNRVRQAIQNAIQERKVYDSEFRVVLPNGSVRWMTARGTVQVNSSGDPVRLLGVSVDVTARKQAELKAQEQRDELEELSQQKTALLEREVVDICAREQRRIAYDLHDSVGQQLVGIALCAKLLEEQLRGERHSEADKAGMIVKLVNDAARQARLTARTLEGADGVGDLKTALQSLAISVSRTCSVKATVTAEGSSLPISPPVAAQLYRIAQEAVHNAVEHGGAGEVQINLASDHEVLVLAIRDDGKGFDSNGSGNGMGLRIMRYRAQCIGGSCYVQSSSEGTIVRCCVPLEPQLAAFGLP